MNKDHDTHNDSDTQHVSGSPHTATNEISEADHDPAQMRNRRLSLVTDDVLLDTPTDPIDQPDEPEQPVEEDENLPTLIGEKSQKEVLSEMGLDADHHNDFSPNRDQLKPENDLGSSHTTGLPWESETGSELPWETQLGTVPQSETQPVEPVETGPEAAEVNDEAHNGSETVEPAVEPETVSHQPLQHQSSDQTEKLPWESDVAPESNLPWESSQTEAEPVAEEAPSVSHELPWEAHEKTDLPWEATEANEKADLPWESEQENSPWESNVESHQDVESHAVPLVTTTVEPPTESPQELNTESHIQASSDKLQSDEEATALFFENLAKEPSPVVSQSLDITAEEELLDVKEDKKLDDLFGDDALLEDEVPEAPSEKPVDVSEEPEVSGLPQPVSEAVAVPETQTIAAPSSDNVTETNELVQKKSLDFLDDDDLLLDDDFLDDTPQVPVKSPPRAKSYLPLSQALVPGAPKGPLYPLYGDNIQSAAKPLNLSYNIALEQQKKKNDAYDFPADLVTTKIKPAARTKYAPSKENSAGPMPVPGNRSSSSTSIPPSSAPGSVPPSAYAPIPAPGPVPPVSAYAPPPAGLSGTAPPPSLYAPSKTSGPPPKAGGLPVSLSSSPNIANAAPSSNASKSSFFEELPLPMPSKATKKPAKIPTPAAKNAVPVVPTATGQSPVLQRNSPQALFSRPMNPYAKVAPSNHVPPASGPVGVIAPKAPRKVSNNTPNINTNLVKTTSGNSQNSPYVPNSGPYAPSNYNRAHSRTNSLIGGKGKEHNPYAPALTPTVVAENGLTQPNEGLSPASIAAVPQFQHSLPGPVGPVGPVGPIGPIVPAQASHNGPHPAPIRARGVSNPKTGLYGRARAQSVGKVQNPAALLERQFPIFNWTNSTNVTYLIPATVNTNFHSGVGNVQIKSCDSMFKDKETLTAFPGPLPRNKSKKKDLEKWLETNIEFLQLLNDPTKIDEILLNKVLLSLVKFDGDIKAEGFSKEVSNNLNPTLTYTAPIPEAMTSLGVSPNAYRLDQSGVNYVFLLIQLGKMEEAVQFSITKGDWAMALVLGMATSKDTFNKVASDYARISFPFHKSNNKVHHMMPLVLKIIAGNSKDVIEDFKNVPAEGEWFSNHWAEFVAIILVNENPAGLQFFHDFGKFLKSINNGIASDICFMLSGTPLSIAPNDSFSYVGGYTTSGIYSEIYEYVAYLASGASSSFSGFPHLLPLKLKHAQVLADYGAGSGAQKYCDYVGNILKGGNRNPYVSPEMITELRKLLMRISDAESSDSGWFGSKISKVNLDKMWGHLDKFIGGEEASKPNEHGGVFSKFSPSVSRTNSVLDFTATSNMPPLQSQPSMLYINPVLGKDQVQPPSLSGLKYGSSNGKYGSSVGLTQGFPQPLVRTPLQENLDSNSVFAFSPSQNQGAFTAPSQIPAASPYTNPRYASSQESGLASNSIVAPPPLAKSASKYAPGGSSVVSASRQSGRPYQNSAAAASNLSLSSHISIRPHPSGPYAPASNSIQTPGSTHASLAVNFEKPDDSATKSPSVQSDVSMDYPAEFKPERRESEVVATVPESEIPIPPKLEPAESQSTIHSYQPPQAEDFQIDIKSDETPQKAEPNVEEVDDVTDQTPSKPPPPKSAAVPPPPKTSVIRKPRANPYAPGSTSKRQSGTSKYANPSAQPFVAPEMKGDMFSYGKAPEAQTKVEQAADVVTSSTPEMEPAHIVSPKMNGLDEPAKLFKTTNVDESFDISEDSPPAVQKQRSPLMLNNTKSPGRESAFTPYQPPQTRPPPAFGMDSSFNFPIPGSPDLTTRANSVVNGMGGGLFSSRLSQSQQSAMYQQYEVQDDTVQDYIPIVDEEDEDSDNEESKKKAKPNKAQPANARGGHGQGHGQGRWLSWLNRGNDDKPKPIRAKLGEQNKFVYDEKLKKWINKDIPLEEQLKPAGPPPPPKMKTAAAPSVGGPAPNRAPMETPVPRKPPVSNEPGLVSPAGAPSGPVAPPGPSAPVPGAAAGPISPGPTSPGPTTSTPGPNGSGPRTSGPGPSSTGPKPPSLATAGLDDLLSLGGSTTSTRKKRGGRRGYVNVLEQK